MAPSFFLLRPDAGGSAFFAAVPVAASALELLLLLHAFSESSFTKISYSFFISNNCLSIFLISNFSLLVTLLFFLVIFGFAFVWQFFLLSYFWFAFVWLFFLFRYFAFAFLTFTTSFFI